MTKEKLTLDPTSKDFETEMTRMREKILREAPAKLKKLGRILRAKSHYRFKLFLKQEGMLKNLRPEQLPLFMDWLITQRIDLKDMEPEARRNLRRHTLKQEVPIIITNDYMVHVERGKEKVTCKHCKWFALAPEDEDKTCIQLGAKGVDEPCKGFIKKMA